MEPQTQTIVSYTNVCNICEQRHTNRKAAIQHLPNTNCDANVDCYCGKKLNKRNAINHMKYCKYLGTLGCLHCKDMRFKCLEKANNHAWSAHGGNQHTTELQGSITYILTAQVGTRFDQMHLKQLQERARDNTHKRTILKELVKESNFAATGSLFYQLVEGFGKHKRVPLFTASRGSMFDMHIVCADGPLLVRLNRKDADFSLLWNRLRLVGGLRAQALFTVEHNVGASDTLAPLVAQMTVLLERMNCTVPVVQQLVSLMCKVVIAFRSKFDPITIGALLIDVLVAGDVSMDLAKQAWDLISTKIKDVWQWFKRSGELVAQVGQDIYVSMATVFSVLCGTMLMKRIPKESEVAECITSVSKLGALVRGATFAWQGLEKLVSCVFKKIVEWHTGCPSEISEMEKFMSGVTDWFKEVQNMIGFHTLDEIARSSELCAKIESLYRQGAQYSVMAMESKCDRALLSPFQLHWSVLKNLYDKANASGAFRAGPRVEPLVIYIYGSSGIGKSGMMYPLATELLKIDGIPRTQDDQPDPTREIYMRNVEQDYWDGYKNQRCVIYDDFSQIVDSASKPNPEFMEIIRTGNLAPYPLHMASIEEKNKTYFNSRVVICTSNLGVRDINPESIHCREALRRRFDVCVEVTNKREFTVEGRDGEYYLSPIKVKRITGNQHDLSVYNIWPVDPLTGFRTTERPLSYEEFARKCIFKYRNRFKKSTEMFDFLKKYADEPILEAQVGYVDLMDWAENALKDAKLATFADIKAWKTAQIMHFGTIYEKIRTCLTDEAQNMCDNLLSFIGEDWFNNEMMWRSAVEELDGFWAKDAVEKLRAIARADCVLLHSLGDVIINVMDKINHHNRSLVHTLETAATDFKVRFGGWLKQAKEIVQAHPLIATGIALLPVLFLGLRAYFGSTKVVAAGVPLSHHHEGLSRGARVLHKHKCLWCGKEYEHNHVIKEVEESLPYGQVCARCDTRTSPLTSYYDAAAQEIVMDNGRQVKRVPFVAELSSSGDTKTRKRETLNVELTSSGDEKTRKKDSLRVELTGSGDQKTRKKDSLRVEIDDEGDDDYHPERAEEIAQAQLQTDPNAFQLSRKIITNTYNLELKIDGRWQTRMKMCFLIGRTAVTAAHLKPYIDKASDIRIWSQTCRDGWTMPIKSIRTVVVKNAAGEHKDQMLIEFPRTIHDHVTILNSVATSAELTSFKKTHACLITPYDDTVITRYGAVLAKDDYRTYTDVDVQYGIRDRYEYTGFETRDGDCGSILMAVSSGLARKIIGLHVAGTRNLGVASPLNATDISKALTQINLSAQIKLDLTGIATPTDDLKIPEGNFVPAGKSAFPIGTPKSTKLRPSVVHGLVTEPTTAPSALGWVNVDGKIVDPMYEGLKKGGDIPPFLDEKKLAAAINDVERVVNSNIAPEHARVLTDMEAVTGYEGDEFVGPINRKSSPGFPWVKDKQGKPGKTRWLGSEEYELDPELQKRMAEIEARAADNERTPAIWSDTLKDERRPLEKVRIGKTRVFSAGPIDYTLVFRKYFLGFAAHCAKNRIDNEISIGTNVYSYDWTKTAKRLTSKGWKVIAGDFKNFDGTLLLQILADVVEIVNAFYDDGEEIFTIRRVLWKEIVNSIHIVGGVIYFWTHGQPSGCPITAILNSLFNSISMRYVWLVVVPPELQTMKAFNEHVAMVSYGDDNCVNISDAVIDVFNQITIAEGYATIGMTYTDEAKTGEMIPYRSIGEISYLKRTFTYSEEEKQFIAPLDLGVVLEMINWIRTDFDQEEATAENMQTSAFELTLHGREVFEHWIRKYRAVSHSFTERPLFLTFDEYREVEARKYGRLAACSLA